MKYQIPGNLGTYFERKIKQFLFIVKVWNTKLKNNDPY